MSRILSPLFVTALLMGGGAMALAHTPSSLGGGDGPIPFGDSTHGIVVILGTEIGNGFIPLGSASCSSAVCDARKATALAPRPLDSKLRMQWTASGGVVIDTTKPDPLAKLPLRMLFQNQTDVAQSFLSSEYNFQLLTSDGQQVEGAVVRNAAVETVTLSGRSTVHLPEVWIDASRLAAGETYFFACQVRNLMGLLQVTTK